ncbi:MULTISPECIES: cation diffusion facilitator family transporter [Exiguobacterium]|jgi:cobalt-zinc-cadmium efflux system protein|uniref:Cadmium, cobalt and zinc/H(+)-K(+) antiporter n=2 Tax=Exiguobacterium TaxID=33986 RepID=A0A377HH35_9BACL|nr:MULTISPECIES: cation diffusion facilitator family transporter [Exiguobacterium]MDL5376249.1 cation diffusion facilitator family transporter [Exiguobacterium mexicanum]TCI66645.1 cation transporter [Exiguobacterium sp. IPCI3]TCI75968.1 cation transporter [Exiguobacterium sp. IPCH1]TCI76860.1 cation transporter [Exiguobacterium sp. IPBC4]STO53177.1 Cadmium, cobalt and zinc/H(+)-K(+) antiporter [Exiguobacterium aurantiacum]
MASTDKASKNIKLAFIINLVFSIGEFIGGFLINSVAIMSDAIHDLGDALALGLSWFLQKFSNKKPDHNFTFGYNRFSLLGALINATILIIGSVYIFTQAIPLLFEPEHSNAQGMIWFAIFGVLLNGFAAFRLHKGKSVNEGVLSWHLLEDVLGWIAVLVVGIVLLFKDIHILDPILSIAIALFILVNVFRNLVKTMKILLGAVPDGIDIDEVKQKIEGIEEVISVQNLYVWSIDGEDNAMNLHLIVEEMNLKDSTIVKQKVKEVTSKLDIKHSTIELESKKHN